MNGFCCYCLHHCGIIINLSKLIVFPGFSRATTPLPPHPCLYTPLSLHAPVLLFLSTSVGVGDMASRQ